MKLKLGLVLFQPWATKIAKGELPILIRPISTKNRQRVAILSSTGIDGIYFSKNLSSKNVKPNEQEYKKDCAIGSVLIANCIPAKQYDVFKVIEKITKNKKIKKIYPKYLIPLKFQVYIWILKKPKLWKIPKKYKCKSKHAIMWRKISLTDE